MLDHNSKSLSSKIVLGAIALLVWTGNAFGKAKHYGQLFLDTGAPKSGAQVHVYSGAERRGEELDVKIATYRPNTSATCGPLR